MLRQRLTGKSERDGYQYQSTPRLSQYDNYDNPKIDKPILSETKLAVVGLVLSILVISGKLFSAYCDDIKKFVVDRQLFSIEVVNEEGQVMYHYVWKNVVKYSNIWFPLLCGALSTYFTWLMVYLDSNVPGVQPPSPFSPTKYKQKSGHSFHLNYIFAVIIGILVTFYMYWRNVSIEFF